MELKQEIRDELDELERQERQAILEAKKLEEERLSLSWWKRIFTSEIEQPVARFSGNRIGRSITLSWKNKPIARFTGSRNR